MNFLENLWNKLNIKNNQITTDLHLQKISIEKKYKNDEIKKEQLPRDVLTILLLNEDKIELSDEIIKREIAFYLQAGSHSTANSMTHALHEIYTWCDGSHKKMKKIKFVWKLALALVR